MSGDYIWIQNKPAFHSTNLHKNVKSSNQKVLNDFVWKSQVLLRETQYAEYTYMYISSELRQMWGRCTMHIYNVHIHFISAIYIWVKMKNQIGFCTSQKKNEMHMFYEIGDIISANAICIICKGYIIWKYYILSARTELIFIRKIRFKSV